MAELLAENNICGQQILRLVSRGNAIIAELLRLKDFIPRIYKTNSKSELQKYAGVIFDFAYFKASEAIELKIEKSHELRDLDDEIRENHLETLTRFYLTFESIHTYVTDLNSFIDDLDEGTYIQHSLEFIMQDIEGKQLMCEALYLYGVMLLVTDLHIEGTVREKILVSYYRYSPQRSDTQSHFDYVCKLLRTTGFSNTSGTKRNPTYPDEYFKRIPVNPMYVDFVVGRLRSDDVYNQITAYPLPEHRSTALANQAAMLFTCLLFHPKILHSQTPKMREIVDKFFPDNWIVSVYMGLTVNLIDFWEPYKAAKSALNNTLEASNVKEIGLKYGESVRRLIPLTKSILKEGTLSEDRLMTGLNKVTNLCRECNVTLRWVMLHTTSPTLRCDANKRCKNIRDQIYSESKHDPKEAFELLLNTSQLELKINEMIKRLLAEKDSNWEKYRSECSARMSELAEVFGGAKALTRIEKNEKLQAWFEAVAHEIDSLDRQTGGTNRKIVQLISSLEQVMELQPVEANLQVKQFLVDTKRFLNQMLRSSNIKEDSLVTFGIIGDLSYAWETIDDFTPIMQESIKKEPSLVIKLRATFLKLVSAMEIPLLRINQARSEDLESVSKYYSNELVGYVRKVLQIIPETMFSLLSRIVQLQTTQIKEMPTKVDKEKLREFAHLNERFEVAELTHAIAVFSEGICMMKTTLVGVICIDPKQLLEDGIRRELVNNLSKALHEGLVFNAKKPNELYSKLEALISVMSGFKRSFEYIQDYVNINGLKIWQEEIARIINFNVEQECNCFLRSKIQDWQSMHQNKNIPIPNYGALDSNAVNFIGRLANEIIRVTDPKHSVYLEQTSAWYDAKTQKEVLSLAFFSKISAAIGPVGLVGLDRFLSFMIASHLQKCILTMQRGVQKDESWSNVLTALDAELGENFTVTNPSKFYQNYTNRAIYVWPQLLDWVLQTGQLQILRKHIAFELNTSCRFSSKNFESSLRLLNEVLLKMMKDHLKDPTNKYPNEALLFELSRYLDWAGIYDPYKRVYVPGKNVPGFPAIMFLFVVFELQKLQYVKNIDSLIAKRTQDQLDGMPFMVGIHSMFKQFHSDLRSEFFQYMKQYIFSILDHTLGAKNIDFPPDASVPLYFVEKFCLVSGISRKEMYSYIPEQIFCNCRYLCAKSPMC